MSTAVTGTESLPARRVAFLAWLARNGDPRVSAELCGETRDWAAATAAAAGHPDPAKVRAALAEARQALAAERALQVRTTTTFRPAPAPAPVAAPAPVRPIRQALAEHVAAYAGPAAPAVNLHHVDPSAILPAAADAPHLHTFFEAERGVVRCEGCTSSWRSAPCEVCQVTVAAHHIARTGRARHTWHPETTGPAQEQQALAGDRP